MKPRLLNSILIPAIVLLASCSAGLQVNKTSSWDDEIYGTSNPKIIKADVVNDQQVEPSAKQQQYNKLDDKFAEALKALDDSSKNDTIVYEAEDTNPYSRILSDSYEESYERRLRGLEDPQYRIENWSVYYSDDYRYAQAYDPSFYRIVVMGSNVWVEPWYVYNSFGWPRSSLYFGFGFGWGYNPWYSFYSGYYWDPWYYNPWYSNSLYYSPYLGYSTYWSGWYDATYYSNSSNSYYGRRRVSPTNNTEQYVGGRSSTISPTDGQAVATQRSRIDNKTESNPIVTTREVQTRVSPTYETQRSEGRTSSTGAQTVTRRETSSTRVVNGNNNSTTRTSRPSKEIGIAEPTRYGTTPTYERPRTGSTGDYNTTRRVENPTTSPTITRKPSTTAPTRTSTPTYNRPSRVSTPSTTQPSTRNYNYDMPRNSGNSRPSSVSSPPSRPSTNSSSGSSSSGSSSRNSSGSSSGSSTVRNR